MHIFDYRIIFRIQKHADEALRDNSSMVDKLLKKAGRAEADKRKALEKELKHCRARLSFVNQFFLRASVRFGKRHCVAAVPTLRI